MAHKRPAGAVLLAVLTLAGCSGGGEPPAPTPSVLQGLPTAEEMADPGSVVPAGEWGVVGFTDTSTDAVTTFAIRIDDLAEGEAGAFADVQLMNGIGNGDLESAVPYYVSFTYAVIEGDPNNSPIQSLVATDDTQSSNVMSLSVPDSLEECATPGLHHYGEPAGTGNTGCAVAAAMEGATPSGLVYTTSYGGPEPVTFALP